MILSASYAAHAKSLDIRQANNENNPSPRRCGRVGHFNKQVLLAMKLMAVLLLVACMQVSARGFGQGKVTISLRDVLVTEVFKEIEKQTSFRFLYRDELVKKAGVISINVKDVPVETALNKCFDKKPLEYKIFKETIVISEKGASVSSGGGTGMIEVPLAQINVSGRVLNEQGKPVEGVTVTIKGTDKSTFTNANGEFFLSSVEQDAVLVFTSVNMEAFELKVSGKSELVVNLKAKVSELGNVEVVHTGYQEVPRERATGSFVFINQQQLDQRIAPDIITKLEGIASGLVFVKNPDNGGNKLRIRGESTIFGNAEPLIVVDGFPYSGDINNINPYDVDNITILKDASAASIWGVQAGNGVIIINTKKGKLNQGLKLELITNLTIQEKPDLLYRPLIGSSEYIDLEKYLFENAYYDQYEYDPAFPPLSPVVEILIKKRDGLISDQQATDEINKYRNLNYRKELLNHAYRRGVTQQYSANVRGGSNKASYYLSAGYDKSFTSIVGNTSERITVRAGNTFLPFKKLEVSTNLVYTEGANVDNGLPDNNISNVYPYTNLKDGNGNYLPVPQYRQKFLDTASLYGFPDWNYYPLREKDYKDYKSKLFDTRFQAQVRYTIIEGVTLEGSYQYGRSASKIRNLDKKESYQIRNRINNFAIVDNGFFMGSNYPDGGRLNVLNSELVSHNLRFKIDFNRTWLDHSVAAIAGVDVREVKTEASSNLFHGFDNDNGTFVSPDYFQLYNLYPTGTSNFERGISYGGTLNRFRSYYGVISYTFKNKYVLSGTGRIDGSNYFGVNTNLKSIPLWSTGLRWALSKENFYKSSLFPIVNLRATYGYNGNLSTSLAGITTFRYTGLDQYTGLPYAYINTVQNPELRWEKTGQLNVGIDFSTKNNIITGIIEYFVKKGVNLIGDAPVDPTSGINIARGNFSALKTRGVDVSITTRNINRKLEWSTTFIFNYSADEVTKYDIPVPVGKYTNAYVQVQPIVGKPLYSLYSYRWGGLDPENGDPIGYLADTLTNDYYSILNLSTNQDLVYNGRYNPPLTGSLINNLRWNGFNLSINVIFKAGHYFRRNSINYTNLLGSGLKNWQTTAHIDFLNRWQKPGDEEITDIPSFIYPTFSSRDAFYSFSDILVEKADHVRLQFIRLGYTFQKKPGRNIPFFNTQIYLYANNLGILWRANDKKIDPDFPYLNNAPSKSWSLGIQTNF